MSNSQPQIGRSRRSIGIVTGSASRQAGGLFNSVRESALHLRQAGINIGVYALRDEFSDRDIGEWAPLRPQMFDTSGPAALGIGKSLSNALLSSDHDVLHLHGIWQFLSRDVDRWKRATGRPVMISPRGMLDPWALRNSRWKKRIAALLFEDANLNHADCLHALNASEAASMRAYGLENPIAIIPNGAALPDHVVRTSRDGRRTLLFLGRIHPKKGLIELVRAWAAAREIDRGFGAEWQMIIAGWDDGGHLDALKAEVQALRIETEVTFHGPAFGQDKDELMRAADAFVLPSFSEGLPMSVLEAWAYSLPVLMTPHCNLPSGFSNRAAIEIWTEVDTLAAQLIAALSRSDLQAIGANGRALVQSDFSWDRIAYDHARVYDWLCGGSAMPDCVQIT